MAASSLDLARAWGAARRLGLGFALAACSVGHGSGQLQGTLTIEGCRRAGSYSLVPNSFFAEAVEKLLKIRVQRGGDIEVYSDGVALLVEDSALMKREYLHTPIDVASDAEPRVSLTAYFNDTCPPGREKTPVVLKAVSGSVRFDAVYAPEVAPDEVRISAVLDDVRFEDEDDPEARWAELSGDFDFLYVRGSPAQRFP